jgi:hypothetical protein
MNVFNFFALNFKIFGGEDLGFWLTSISGLLLPIWVVWMFDMTRRKKFGEAVIRDSFCCCFLPSITLVRFTIIAIAAPWHHSD